MLITIIISVLLVIYTVQDVMNKKIHMAYSIAALFLLLISIILYKDYMVVQRLGGIMVGIAMYALSVITKEQIGKGDAYILMVTGLGLGFWNNMSFFFLSLLCACAFAIFKIMIKGYRKRETIPFVPFMLMGFLIFTLLDM